MTIGGATPEEFYAAVENSIKFPADPALMHDREGYSTCLIHHAWELIPENVYKVCFECGHVWLKDDLLKAHNDFAAKYEDDIEPLTDPELIFFCQECLHDW